MRKTGVILSLKTLVVVCGAVFAFAAVWLVPYAGVLLAGAFSDQIPAPLCTAYLYLAMVPAALALIDAWVIFREIGLDRSFTRENAARLRRISLYAVADTLLFGALCVALYLQSVAGVVNFPAFIALVITFFGVLLTVVVRALSSLVLDAARIKDENDLTV